MAAKLNLSKFLDAADNEAGAELAIAVEPAPAAVTPPARPAIARQAKAKPRATAQVDETPASEIAAINIFVATDDRRRLKQLSLDTGLSIQKLGHQAWNLLLESRGLPPLRPTSANVPSGRSKV